MKIEGYQYLSGMIQDHCNQWARKIGDHPRRMSFRQRVFDRLCAEAADAMMRRDESILKMIQSFKIAGPNGYIVIERDEELKP